MISTENSTLIWRKACAVSLAELPAMGPKRLSSLLSDMPPEAAWEALGSRRSLPKIFIQACGSRYQDLLQTWQGSIRSTDPMFVLSRYEQLGIGVWSQLDEYPVVLENDPYAPAILFWRGHQSALENPRVAVIGTRNCTYEGKATARRFGAELTAAGISVVSGLALGIDGAAHQGALSVKDGVPPIAVVGSGLDVIYPKRNHEVWKQIAEFGLLLTESPLGAMPEPWRFPARNRIIAGLADLILVVESHERGGSLLTVDEAAERGIPVMAVPGSINSPASRGTNALIADGVAPACEVSDVLDVLSVTDRTPASPMPDEFPEDPIQSEVLEAVDWYPTSTNDVIFRTGRSLGEVAAALTLLEQDGWVQGGGGWWQRIEPSQQK